MTKAANLGFPRIGLKRELKVAVEAYWKGELDAPNLISAGADLRARHWRLQQETGLAVIPSNDFSFYDQMLDMTATVGAVPARFIEGGAGRPTHAGGTGRSAMEQATRGAGHPELDLYFAMARGTSDAPAMEMTKWFDTNYHYIVPEFHKGQAFHLSSRKTVDEFEEAKALGITTRPVLIGPVTYLMLGKAKAEEFDTLALLDALLPVYCELLDALRKSGADWVQLDEPVLALDLTQNQKRALRLAYRQLAAKAPKIMLASYFGEYGDNLAVAADLPVAGHHADLVRGRGELDRLLGAFSDDRVLSLGVVDGRNVWRSDLGGAFDLVEKALTARKADLLEVAPSCSLLHVPVDLDAEKKLDPELKSWMAFAKQKLGEVVELATAAHSGPDSAKQAFEAGDLARESQASSPRIHDALVTQRTATVSSSDFSRKSPFKTRRKKQRRALSLPAFPTTTIGSFPQTAEVRKARAAHRKGELDDAAYEAFLRKETEAAVRMQEEAGLDVLVHGEFERNDMVEYFGEQLTGFAFTQNGWVQSYGSRCVKPPVIFGDVSRPRPMTVDWATYAQSLTTKPMKGMLTGPVTILQWSFVRDDQPRSETCQQIALAIRDEVADLERAGIKIIQIDEPALREGLPLRQSERAEYLKWAVDCFRLASSGVADETQIHTHMCYCEFNDIMPSIAALDADVISIETSRSDMELLNSFSDFSYPNEIGPGVYDIHSPRCPSAPDMVRLLSQAKKHLALGQIWVNPDCGLKTRRWEEVRPALANMVEAARRLREGPAEAAK
ncbi:MAG: 5-methyltetrahydropteroyltriglutamate--homocysteine S-methyltransferase [Hyphomicrobiaceae bacterium]